MKNTKEKSLKNTFHTPSNIQMCEPATLDMWTLSVAAFHAKTSQLLELVPALMGKDQGYGVICLEFVAKFDPSTLSLKTAQCLLLEDYVGSYQTLPKSGTMLSGNVYRTSALDSHTSAKGFTLLPTPTKSDYKDTFLKMENLNQYLKNGHQVNLTALLAQKGFTKSQRVQLLEMAMGFPIGYTELGVSETL